MQNYFKSETPPPPVQRTPVGTAEVEIGPDPDRRTVPATLSGWIADKPRTRCSPAEPEINGEIFIRFTIDGQDYLIAAQMR